jgi:hypothetical protein
MQALVLLPDWQCATCTAAQKVSRGCEDIATKPVELDGELQQRCPRRVLLDRPAWIGEVWWLYSKYVDGIFPEHGGLNDQPAKFIAVARLLEVTKSAADGEKEQREKKRKAAQALANRTFNGEAG